MKNGTYYCDCKVGYGGNECELTPCSTCASWDLIGPGGTNHATYSQRNSYCDVIADPNDPACYNGGTCKDCVNHSLVCQSHIVRKSTFFINAQTFS